MAWFPCYPVYQFFRLGTESDCYGYGSTNPIEVYNVVVASNATNMALDFLILLLPIPLLFSSDTIRRTKLGLFGLLFLGVLINAIAAARIVANKATSNQKPDPTRVFPIIILLGETENRLSLVLASIPVFWPVVTKTWNNFIFVTHEVKVESTHNLPSMMELGRISLRDHQTGTATMTATNEDEATETGLRHPGRLLEVDRYVRQLISPFAEGNPAKKEPTVREREEVQRGFNEELEGHSLHFETVPDIAQPEGSPPRVESRGSEARAAG
ncbi:hypothetical protein CkaCkLH20_08091 [Colletotrichum karsti]|uniref:Rhodopsin domain-containing protein n=1 Tax=Colletotrichum karsti TaxID=1095194 RepID=A0A9P6LIE5_9PEZI|nr:uncharacterized protein CkaCkLH20_08091 [Colletotrichum karsti]KAF9874528.1 hypothetical protein CkaCkLH20_08091 [Colletotrichum karsti]